MYLAIYSFEIRNKGNYSYDQSKQLLHFLLICVPVISCKYIYYTSLQINKMKRSALNEQVRRSKRSRFRCQECTNIDDDEMVFCDECFKFSHYRCAGVDEEIKNLSFICRWCKDVENYINSTGNKSFF